MCCCSSRFHQLLPSSSRVVLQRLGLVMGAIAAFEGGVTATQLLQAICELAQRQASQPLCAQVLWTDIHESASCVPHCHAWHDAVRWQETSSDLQAHSVWALSVLASMLPLQIFQALMLRPLCRTPCLQPLSC